MVIHDRNLAPNAAVAADLHGDHLAVHWANGGQSRFHYQWLRDNCRSEGRVST